MNYLLDTNILLIYLRAKKEREKIEIDYNPFGINNNPMTSIVCIGEVKSIARRNYWGNKRLQLLDEILSSLIIIDIKSEDILEEYAEVDAYSQGKIKENPLPMTSRNMGKNDIWIAATAIVTKSVLLTTDKDFEHLHDKYLEVITIKY